MPAPNLHQPEPEQPRETTPVENPYRHDHNPLNEDFHGGICSACEWEQDRLGGDIEAAIELLAGEGVIYRYRRPHQEPGSTIA